MIPLFEYTGIASPFRRFEFVSPPLLVVYFCLFLFLYLVRTSQHANKAFVTPENGAVTCPAEPKTGAVTR
jgi:hypothetical protein